LRGLVAELAERGLKVDYRSVWEFVHAEKLLGKLRISPNLKSSCFSQSGHHPRHWCRSSKSSKCGARGGERLKSARRVAAGYNFYRVRNSHFAYNLESKGLVASD
jgi:hypothetical protein